MAPMKRKATFAKRAAKRSRGSQLVPTVVSAIASAETLPDNLRSLLKSTLPIVLNANKVDRHAYEAEVVDQAAQALTAAQAALEQKHKEALAEQNSVISPQEADKRASGKKVAEEALEAAKTKLEADKASKKAAEKAEEDAESALKTAKKEADAVVKAAQKEENAADRELQHLNTKKIALTNALASEFAMLTEGNTATAAGKKALNTLLKFGREYGLGSTLLSTLPHSCKTPAPNRTEFEKESLARYQAQINERIAELTQKIAGAEATKGEKSAATAAAQGALEQATGAAKGVLEEANAALKAAEAELEATQNSCKETGKAVTAADKHLRHIWADMMHACDAQDKLASDVMHFKEAVWGAFNQLKEKEPEPEPAGEEK